MFVRDYPGQAEVEGRSILPVSSTIHWAVVPNKIKRNRAPECISLLPASAPMCPAVSHACLTWPEGLDLLTVSQNRPFLPKTAFVRSLVIAVRQLSQAKSLNGQLKLSQGGQTGRWADLP